MHTATVTFAADGTPSISNAVETSFFGGVLAGVTGVLSHTQVVLPGSLVEKLAVEGTKVAAGAVAQKYISTGELGIPFKA